MLSGSAQMELQRRCPLLRKRCPNQTSPALTRQKRVIRHSLIPTSGRRAPMSSTSASSGNYLARCCLSSAMWVESSGTNTRPLIWIPFRG